jgi:hypothetical protein
MGVGVKVGVDVTVGVRVSVGVPVGPGVSVGTGVQVGGYVGTASVGVPGTDAADSPDPVIPITNGSAGLNVRKMTPKTSTVKTIITSTTKRRMVVKPSLSIETPPYEWQIAMPSVTPGGRQKTGIVHHNK